MQNGGPSVAETETGVSRLSVDANGSNTAIQSDAGAIVPVGKVQSVSLPAPNLDGVRSVDTHTRDVGVIQPPPDLKVIIDKTATFVARNGKQFEARIIEQQRDNSRFNFLKPNDVYHAYFKHAIARGIKETAGDQNSSALEQAEQAAALAKQAAPAPPVAPSTLAKPLVAPEPDMFSVRTPEGLTGEHVDIIKLTAQCVARNGPNFLTGLGQREQGNSTFLFLKPTHSLHGYFKDLTEAYKFTLMPPKELMNKLRKDATERQAVLERCLNRLEWEKNKEAQDKAASDKATAERLAMQSIDWHDFVVVETIDFFDDEDSELPAPMTQTDIVLLNRANAFRDENAADNTEGGQANGVEDVQMDDDERAMIEEGNTAPGESAAQPTVPQEAQIRIEDDDDEPMRIVKDYQRPSARPAGQGMAGMAISPITGELVPHSEMAEHMRISLINPQYRTQREAMLAKIRETTQATDDEISRNLVDLAGHRPDVFGSSEEEVGAMVKASMDEKKMTGNDRTPAWDGQTMGGVSLSNQMKAIDEHKADSNKRKEPESAALPTPILGPMPTNLPPPPSGSGLPAPPVRLPAGAPAAITSLPAPGPPPPLARPPPAAPPAVGPPPTLAPPPIVRPPPIVQQPLPPPPAPGAGPLPAMPSPPPVPSEQPDAKRQRVDFVLQSEEDFLQQYPGASKVRILCPEEADNANLNGQVLEVEVASLSSSIGELKSRLSDVLGLPPNKQQLSREHFRNLKDIDTLAYYNVSPEVELVLGVRRRGGR